MKFRGVESNSTIREIGSLFRSLDGSDWHINVKLAPGQKKQHFGISQIPVLARRRVLNPTESRRPAGFKSIVAIQSTRAWGAELISSCPIPAVKKQEDANQWCFVFEHNETRYFLPQLELARVLFFHHAYLARLSLIHQGLTQEFDVQRLDKLAKARINILPTCTLPLHVRGDYGPRRVLAWILLDADARQSFESIARYQLQDGTDGDKCRLWRFKFDPPLLENVELTLRGHFDQERKAFFVYEVFGVSNLARDCPDHVDFFDPRYLVRQPGQGRVVKPGSASVPEPEVDDDQDPDPDDSEVLIETPKVALEFAQPFYTTRIGKGRGQSVGKVQEGDGTTPPTDTGPEVSTDEATVQGTVPSAEYDGLEDKSDDAHLYADKFVAFEAMVKQLVAMPGCRHTRRETHKLPAVEGYSKHLLADGNPRCLAFHLIHKSGAVYALVEVDTSDNRNRLSTLLLRQPASKLDWDQLLRDLEVRLVSRSLVWPTPFLKKTFGSNYKRIPHPKTSSANKALLEQESIDRWAERVHSEMAAL